MTTDTRTHTHTHITETLRTLAYVINVFKRRKEEQLGQTNTLSLSLSFSLSLSLSFSSSIFAVSGRPVVFFSLSVSCLSFCRIICFSFFFYLFYLFQSRKSPKNCTLINGRRTRALSVFTVKKKEFFEGKILLCEISTLYIINL